MDKCIIKGTGRPYKGCVVRLNAETHRELMALSMRTGRSAASLAAELLNFALERVVVDNQYVDDEDY